MKTYALVLAAGKGTRMKSNIPKCAFPILDKPIIEYVVERFEKSKYVDETILIVGYKKEYFYEHLSNRVIFAEQIEQKGTGHAVKCAIHHLEDKEGQTFIVPGDVPLLTPELTDEIIEKHLKEGNDLTVCTMILDDPLQYGRIIKDSKGQVLKIVEHKNATKKERLVKEVNTSIYVVKNGLLLEYINKIQPNELTEEYYLTDIVELMSANYKVGAFVIEDTYQTAGINDNKQASAIEEYLKEKINNKLMLNGVTMESPQTIRVSVDAVIEPGVTIKQNTIINGKSIIKKNSIIGPNTTIMNSKIDEEVIVEDSVIANSTIGEKSYVGPFAHIRDLSVIGKNVRVGNFTEVKNSTIGDDSFASHHAYIGDTKAGKRVNFGCGSVTVNFDGKEKYQTVIGNDVFIGCNVNLIAPIKIDDDVIIAAGSTITEDVKKGSLAIARNRQEVKEDFYYKHFNKIKNENNKWFYS